eukprot:172174_1
MASKSLPPISEEKQLSDQKLSHNASMDVRREFHKMQLNDDRPKQRRIVVAMDSSDEASRSFLYAVREVANQNERFIDTLLLMRSEHRWGPDTLNSTIEGNKRETEYLILPQYPESPQKKRVDEATNDLNKFEKLENVSRFGLSPMLFCAKINVKKLFIFRGKWTQLYW